MDQAHPRGMAGKKGGGGELADSLQRIRENL